jgi:AcrR family transcriptional regulator
MENKENLTRSYIFKAYLKLLESKPFEKISVSEITKKAGVSRMSFYRNFSSKEDLTFQGIDEIIINIKQNIKKYNKVNIFVITKEVFEEAKKYKNAFLSFDNSPFSRQIMSVSASRLKDNIPIDYINRTSKYIPIFYFSAVCTTMFEWLKNGTQESSDEMARMISSLINIEHEE